jgi:hypothetical protein
MKQLTFCLLAHCLLLAACQVNSSNRADGIRKGPAGAMGSDSLLYKEVVLQNNFADTCIVFKYDNGDTIRFNRNFEIVENTFGDTMNVALNYVKPGDKGKYFTIQIDTTRGTIFKDKEYKEYLEENDLPELYTQWLCFYNLNIRWWGKTTRTGQMRIRVYYKPQKAAASGKG